MRPIDADALIEQIDIDSDGRRGQYGDEWKFMDTIEAMPTIEPEREWIPCSERLPEAGSWAIWCSDKGIIQVARWKMDAIDHFFPDQGFFQLEDAVAWMPLPEPYGGESE